MASSILVERLDSFGGTAVCFSVGCGVGCSLDASDEVRNIAITGEYGAGKSSVIRTFVDRHPESQ